MIVANAYLGSERLDRHQDKKDAWFLSERPVVLMRTQGWAGKLQRIYLENESPGQSF
jgi:hypothetical protein